MSLRDNLFVFLLFPILTSSYNLLFKCQSDCILNHWNIIKNDKTHKNYKNTFVVWINCILAYFLLLQKNLYLYVCMQAKKEKKKKTNQQVYTQICVAHCLAISTKYVNMIVRALVQWKLSTFIII